MGRQMPSSGWAEAGTWRDWGTATFAQAVFFTEIMANHVTTGNSLFREVLVRKDVDH